jgi:hypothetical protein
MKRRYDAMLENQIIHSTHWLWGRIVEAGKRGNIGAEIKANAQQRKPRQELIDSQSEALRQAGVEGVVSLRIGAHQVPERVLLGIADELLERQVRAAAITPAQKAQLLRAVRDWRRDQESSGTIGELIAALARASDPSEE